MYTPADGVDEAHETLSGPATRKLPCDDLFDRLRLCFIEAAFFLEKLIEARSHVLLAHCFNSFWRLRAIARSASGAARVFLWLLYHPAPAVPIQCGVYHIKCRFPHFHNPDDVDPCPP